MQVENLRLSSGRGIIRQIKTAQVGAASPVAPDDDGVQQNLTLLNALPGETQREIPFERGARCVALPPQSGGGGPFSCLADGLERAPSGGAWLNAEVEIRCRELFPLYLMCL